MIYVSIRHDYLKNLKNYSDQHVQICQGKSNWLRNDCDNGVSLQD